VLDKTRIASGYAFRTDPAAFLVGPTGLAFNACTDTLYVASTGDNAIYAIKNAQFTGPHGGTGNLIFSDEHLRGPLALGFAPNGDLLAANGDAVNPDTSLTNPQNSEIVEFTTSGKFVDEFQIDPTIGGAFGFAVQSQGNQTVFAAVDDVTNQLDVWLV
jgi:DNA-binding beta-propeller fold protein YncE